MSISKIEKSFFFLDTQGRNADSAGSANHAATQQTSQSAVAEPLLVAIAVVVGVGFGGGCRVGVRTEQHVGVTLRCGFDSGTQTGAARPQKILRYSIFIPARKSDSS